ncbi:MAG: glutathione S-transferase, partial [Kordiimonadaceae bacterium]|nr:glutathione S-transferase [Kordiimonadaceae bacterium]MBT6329235.1 glutathione S-transferase [Kordiimonadaceae bacterium]
MTDHPVLYSFRRCPYAIRARLALFACNITCELREVVLRDKPQEMITISPKATVPVLELTSGEVIDESQDIVNWVIKQNDPNGWSKYLDEM